MTTKSNVSAFRKCDSTLFNEATRSLLPSDIAIIRGECTAEQRVMIEPGGAFYPLRLKFLLLLEQQLKNSELP